MKFQKISDEKLLEVTKQKVSEEKMLTIEILHHLCEIERRQLFLRMGFSSLFEYCVEELGYSESAAFRRISSMRLIADVPSAEEKLEKGSVNVSTLSQLQKFIRKEERFRGVKMDLQDKEELLARIEHKSQQDVEREFATISPHIALSTERHRAITHDLTEVKIVIDSKLVEKLEKLKSLLSHKKPNASFVELVEIMTDMALKKLEPKKPDPLALERYEASKKEKLFRGFDRINASGFTSAAEVKPNQRYIPSVYRQQVWHRDGGRCAFVDPLTRRKCLSNHKVQIDHFIPIQGGGKTELGNLRLMCAIHNRWKGNHLHR
jgi:hypothetical protein